MNIYIPLTLALGASHLAGAQGATNAPPAATNVLAIYLLADRVSVEQLVNRTVTVENVKLVDTPVLADADFLTCDVTKDSFVITPRAAIRFGIATFANRVPYVMVAQGQRIYLGVFDTYVSSGGTGMPGAFPDMVLMDCFMGPNNIPEEVLAAIRTRERVVPESVLALANRRPTTNVVVTIPTLGDRRVVAAATTLLRGRKP